MEQKLFFSHEYDSPKAALRARNEYAKAQRKAGYTVLSSSLGNQLIYVGVYPAVRQRWVKCYMATVLDAAENLDYNAQVNARRGN